MLLGLVNLEVVVVVEGTGILQELACCRKAHLGEGRHTCRHAESVHGLVTTFESLQPHNTIHKYIGQNTVFSTQARIPCNQQ